MTTKELLKQTLDYVNPVIWKLIGFDILQWLLVLTIFGIEGLIMAIAFKLHLTIVSIIIILLLIASGLFTFFGWIPNALTAKARYIIAKRNNLNPSFSSLWKNSFKIKSKLLKVYLLLFIAEIPLFLIAAIVVVLQPKNPLQIYIPCTLATIASNIIYAITMVAYSTAIIHAIFKSSSSASSSVWYGVKMVLKTRFKQSALLPITVTTIASLLLIIAIIIAAYSGSQLLLTLASVVHISVTAILVNYILGYCLINFYDDQTNIESQSITTT